MIKIGICDDNAKIVRKDNIDYTKLVNKCEDVVEEKEENEWVFKLLWIRRKSI